MWATQTGLLRRSVVAGWMVGALVGGAALLAGAPVAWADSTCTVGSGAQYTTISTAVANTSCTTIQVGAGTFAEQVIIDHPLTLSGAGMDQTTIAYVAGSISNPQTDGQWTPVLWIKSGGVTVKNLAVNGQHSAIALLGIDLYTGGITVDSVLVTGMGGLPGTNVNGTMGAGIGSAANSSNGQQVTVQNSRFQDFTYTGVMGGPPGAPFRFTGNTVIQPAVPGLVGAYMGGDIEGNIFKNFHANGQPPNYAPGAITDAALVIGSGTVANNSFINDDNGIIVSGAPATVTITGNTFTTAQTAIVLAMNQQPQVVRNNQIIGVSTGAWGYDAGSGILVCGEQGDTVAGNTISGAARYGIDVLAYQTAGCRNAGPGTYPTANNTISGNTISGSGGADLHDTTNGAGASGTANKYSGNTCGTSQPGGLCAVLNGGGGGSSGTATPTATTGGTATLAPSETATTSTGGSTTGSAHHGGGSGGAPWGVIVAIVMMVLLGAGGAGTFFFLRQRNAPLEPIPAGSKGNWEPTDPDANTWP